MHNILFSEVQLQSPTHVYIYTLNIRKKMYTHRHTLGHSLTLMDSSGELKTSCAQWESR